MYKPRIVLHGMSSKYARTEERVRKKAIHIYNSTTTGSRCPGRFGKKKEQETTICTKTDSLLEKEETFKKNVENWNLKLRKRYLNITYTHFSRRNDTAKNGRRTRKTDKRKKEERRKKKKYETKREKKHPHARTYTLHACLTYTQTSISER